MIFKIHTGYIKILHEEHRHCLFWHSNIHQPIFASPYQVYSLWLYNYQVVHLQKAVQKQQAAWYVRKIVCCMLPMMMMMKWEEKKNLGITLTRDTDENKWNSCNQDTHMLKKKVEIIYLLGSRKSLWKEKYVILKKAAAT